MSIRQRFKSYGNFHCFHGYKYTTIGEKGTVKQYNFTAKYHGYFTRNDSFCQVDCTQTVNSITKQQAILGQNVTDQ